MVKSRARLPAGSGGSSPCCGAATGCGVGRGWGAAADPGASASLHAARAAVAPGAEASLLRRLWVLGRGAAGWGAGARSAFPPRSPPGPAVAVAAREAASLTNGTRAVSVSTVSGWATSPRRLATMRACSISALKSSAPWVSGTTSSRPAGCAAPRESAAARGIPAGLGAEPLTDRSSSIGAAPVAAPFLHMT